MTIANHIVSPSMHMHSRRKAMCIFKTKCICHFVMGKMTNRWKSNKCDNQVIVNRGLLECHVNIVIVHISAHQVHLSICSNNLSVQISFFSTLSRSLALSCHCHCYYRCFCCGWCTIHWVWVENWIGRIFTALNNYNIFTVFFFGEYFNIWAKMKLYRNCVELWSLKFEREKIMTIVTRTTARPTEPTNERTKKKVASGAVHMELCVATRTKN